MAKAAKASPEAFLNAFIGRPSAPAPRDLAIALGSSAKIWQSLLLGLAKELGPLTHEWSSYSIKAGWSLKVLQRERVILYLAPRQGGFRASFALSDEAMQAARSAEFPPAIKKVLREAKRYAEGSAVRIDIADNDDVETVVTLARIKAAN